MSVGANPFFVTGGTLRHDAPSYVERQADRDLLDGLLKGEFCYVLTSRQMGKSSLMVRAATKLREQGTNVVVLDLTAVGQNLTPEQWYDGLILAMGRQLGLEDALDQFWLKNARLSPVQRFFAAVRDVILEGRPRPLVVFVDETDIVRSLPFSTDEFFAAIRECHNRRTQDAAFNRLTFCLLGVATPSDLIRDTRLTPFNIGRRIELNDFTEGEAAPLEKGFAGDGEMPRRLLRRILDWTGGHPYLTQRFCRAFVESGDAVPAGDVDKLCRGLFLSLQARERDDNLVFVRERLLNGETERAVLLDLYGKVRKGKPVADDESNPVVSALKLSGVVRSDNGRLRLRNRIYKEVFNGHWITANLPEAERLRQRIAFRRGAVGASVALVLLLFVLSLPLFTIPVVAPITSAPGLTNIIVTGSSPADIRCVVVQFQGQVEVRRAASAIWDPPYTNQVLENSDRLRTGVGSHALLRFDPNDTVRIGPRSLITISLRETKKGNALDVFKGFLYLFDRKPTNVIIRTPHAEGRITG